MNWLYQLLGWTTKKKQESALPTLQSIGVSSWDILPPLDPHRFMMALPRLLPAESILCLEGCTICQEVQDFLQAKQIVPSVNVKKNTIWPRSQQFHIPATLENIQAIDLFLSGHESSDICDHFKAYGPAGMVLEWHDSFGDSLFITKAIPEDVVKSFCNEIGSEYEDETVDD